MSAKDRAGDMPAPHETLERIAKAVHIFLEQERDLLDIGINERSLTHRLAVHMQPFFGDWDIDCEYNRLGEKVKNLPSALFSVPINDTEAVTIFPDIIIHRRRTSINLAVIEVKKRGNNDHRLDHDKLRGLTMAGDFDYTVGLHLIIDCRSRKIRGLAFHAGEPNNELTVYVNQVLSTS